MTKGKLNVSMGTILGCVGTSESATKIGSRIRAARTARGWEKAALARKAGVSASYIGRLEAGAYPRPSLQRLTAIADALGLRVIDLTEQPTTDPDAALLEQVRALVGTDETLVRAILADLTARTVDDRLSVLRFMADALRFKPASQTRT